jgi:glycosyltransferase involved in cell wall biosynthesis
LKSDTVKKNRILYVHHTTAIGGATNSLLFTIQQLPKNEYDVKVLFLENVGPAIELYKSYGIDVQTISGVVNYQHANNAIIKWTGKRPWRPITQFIRMLSSIQTILNYLKSSKESFDIVHINTSVMLGVGIACRILGLNLVWHIREPLNHGVLGFRRLIVRSIIKRCANQIIAISNQDKKSLGRCSKCTVIYNYVDFSKFDKNTINHNLNNKINLDINNKIVLMLGGIVHSKGADILIKSIPNVIKQNPEAHFVIAGYPPFISKLAKFKFNKSVSQKCMELIENLNVKDNITFLGLRNDIPQLLSSSYLLVWPATVPHFSRPIIEAQAMGIPPIGTNFEVTKEVIEEGETGLTFENGDATSLAHQINRLLSDTQLYKKISQQAYQQARERFSADTNVKKIINIYQSLV